MRKILLAILIALISFALAQRNVFAQTSQRYDSVWLFEAAPNIPSLWLWIAIATVALISSGMIFLKKKHLAIVLIIFIIFACKKNEAQKNQIENMPPTISAPVGQGSSYEASHEEIMYIDNEVSLNDFEYILDEEEQGIIITRYTGNDIIITIPKEIDNMPVTTIGDWAFANTGINIITISDSITAIGKYAFYSCNRITEIIIPDSVTVIREEAFKDCTGLESVTFGDSDIVIGESAFRNCSNLININLGKGRTSIGKMAFSYCIKLENIGNIDSIISIEENAFYNTGFINITIPKNITVIKKMAFCRCEKLTDVTIHNNVTTIEAAAFSGCSSLENLTIPESVRFIDETAFNNTNLNNVI